MKNRWETFPPRKILHYVTTQLKIIQASIGNDNPMKFKFDPQNFIKYLFENMGLTRKAISDNDNSDYILWKTDPNRFIRYDRLIPIRFSLGAEPNTFATAQITITQTALPFDDNKKIKGTDNFFRTLGKNLPIQINHIIFLRMEAALIVFGSTEKELLNKGVVARHKEFYTESNLNLSPLWDSYNKFKGQLTDMRKKFTLNDLNQSENKIIHRHQKLWNKRNNMINIFKASAEDEEVMNTLIKREDIHGIITHASKGNLTEEFMEWLLERRKIYQIERENK